MSAKKLLVLQFIFLVAPVLVFGQTTILSAESRGASPNGTSSSGAKFSRDGVPFFDEVGGAGFARGINFVRLRGDTGEVIAIENFDFHSDLDQAWFDLVNFVGMIEPSDIVMVAVGDNSGLNSGGIHPVTMVHSCTLKQDAAAQQAIDALESLGAQLLRPGNNSPGLCFRGSWSMIVVAGESLPRAEVVTHPTDDIPNIAVAEATFSLVSPGMPPTCTVDLNASTFVDGETVVADVLRLANTDMEPVAIELKLWLVTPDGSLPILLLGGDGDSGFPASFDIDLGPVDLIPVSMTLPRGAYSLNCRILDPVSGKLLSQDFNPFVIE